VGSWLLPVRYASVPRHSNVSVRLVSTAKRGPRRSLYREISRITNVLHSRHVSVKEALVGEQFINARCTRNENKESQLSHANDAPPAPLRATLHYMDRRTTGTACCWVRDRSAVPRDDGPARL